MRVDHMLCVLTTHTHTQTNIAECFVICFPQAQFKVSEVFIISQKKKAITGQIFITFLSLLLCIIELCY